MAALDFKSDSRISASEREVLRTFCGSLGEDIVALANQLGLKVFAEELWPYDSGYLERAPTCGSSSGFRIVVNKSQSVERQRFTVAHELAHFLLHRHDPNFTFRTETKHRSTDPFDYLEDQDAQMEREANLFAATVLMPPNLFRPAFQRLDGNTEQLARLFCVSQQAARRRIADLGLS